MEFRIADTFTSALARLAAPDQKAVKTAAFDLQMDPSAPSLSFHRIDRSKDPNFWSIRASRDVRVIVHKTASSMLLAYVDHHDKAYAWAERRRIETHPTTGAVQIVEVRERVEEVAPALPFTEFQTPLPAPATATAPPLFGGLSNADFLSVGVPHDWIADLRLATEDDFFALSTHLPAEAAEALLEYAATGMLAKPPAVPAADPYAHPDALRRFRVIENVEELRQALDYPWDRWAIFLHPSQRAVVERSFSGPARVTGSAGTGKTVVALHRAVSLASSDPQAHVLLATFAEPLARALERKLRLLAGPDLGIVPRVTVVALHPLAEELYQLTMGRRPMVASEEVMRGALAKAVAAQGESSFSERFLWSEWTDVVDAWQIADLEGYIAVPRLGRKNRIGQKQRDRLWPIFSTARKNLEARGLFTWPQLMRAVTEYYAGRVKKPFSHVVVDEAQDLGVPELRLIAALAPGTPDALFFAGDLGQRIFQQPFSWKALGVDIRGRSSTLKVNYRTSHQIRLAADRLLPRKVRDVDGNEEDRGGTVSVFEGPEPQLVLVATETEEREAVTAFLREVVAAGVAPNEIGIFVRSRDELPRARAAAKASGFPALELSERGEDAEGRVSVGTMHLAKGLEFKVVAVMACDEDVLPSKTRIENVADEVELEDAYDTERHLFYVACTRARDRLMVSGIAPGSEFLADLG